MRGALSGRGLVGRHVEKRRQVHEARLRHDLLQPGEIIARGRDDEARTADRVGRGFVSDRPGPAARFCAYDASAITYGMPSASLTVGPSQSGAL